MRKFFTVYEKAVIYFNTDHNYVCCYSREQRVLKINFYPEIKKNLKFSELLFKGKSYFIAYTMHRRGHGIGAINKKTLAQVVFK